MANDTPEQSIARLKARANPLVKAFLQKGELQMAVYVESFMADSGASPGQRAGTKIGPQSGALSRSLTQNQPGHIGRYDVPTGDAMSRAVASFIFGIDTEIIPYALAQEKGAEIPVTEKSRSFFWAKFFETGFEMWKNMALTKKTSFTLDPKPYYEPGMKAFEDKQLPKLSRKLMDDMIAVFNGGLV